MASGADASRCHLRPVINLITCLTRLPARPYGAAMAVASSYSARLRVISVAALTLAAVAVAPTPAEAYREQVRCNNLPQDTRCYTGGGYHQFLNVRTALIKPQGYNGVAYGLCAKAVNTYNEVRTGSTCTDGDFVRACFPGANTYSRAYGSHSAGGYFFNALTSFFSGRVDIDVAAATPSDTMGVCGR